MLLLLCAIMGHFAPMGLSDIMGHLPLLQQFAHGSAAPFVAFS